MLTSFSWALLLRPPAVQLLKKFQAFYGTQRFITVFTRPVHRSVSWARSIQYISPHLTSLRSILVITQLSLKNLLYTDFSHSIHQVSLRLLQLPSTQHFLCIVFSWKTTATCFGSVMNHLQVIYIWSLQKLLCLQRISCFRFNIFSWYTVFYRSSLVTLTAHAIGCWTIVWKPNVMTILLGLGIRPFPRPFQNFNNKSNFTVRTF
jgi:hypothetical protein